MAAVWSGRTLTISSTAGLFSQGTGHTSGVLAMGKTRYLNLDDCTYYNGLDTYMKFDAEYPHVGFQQSTSNLRSP